MNRLLIIGCGDVARRALPWLVRRFRVYALVRSTGQDASLRAMGAIPLRADLDRPQTLKRLRGLAEFILHFAPPQEQGQRDDRTRQLLAALSASRSLPRCLVYISSSGVYGDCEGKLINETRTPAPRTERAQRRLDAENTLRGFGVRTRCAVSILRTPGIYAADRLPLERLRRGDPVLTKADDVHTNHIHAGDLARIACLTLYRGRPGRVYNAVDDTQMKMSEYFDHIADTFSLPRPPRVTRSEAAASLSPVKLSFMSESRRLSNLRLKRELGVRLEYPDIERGLTAARSAAGSGA